MIKASEAIQLAGPTIQERVELLSPLIEAAAKLKKRSINVHDSFWVNEGYSQTKDYKAACKILHDLGYKTEFFYEERQFVNMYTIVSW